MKAMHTVLSLGLNLVLARVPKRWAGLALLAIIANEIRGAAVVYTILFSAL